MASHVGDGAAPGRTESSVHPGVWLTDIQLLVMALIWGANYVSVKFGTEVVAPLAFNGLRVTIAAVVLLAIVAATRGVWPSRRDAWHLVLLGVLGNGLYQVLFVEGVAHSRAGDAALILAVSPAFIALMGRIRGVERVSPRGVIGIALSIVGIGLVAYGAPQTGGQHATLWGDLFCLGGAFCWSLYTVLLQPYTKRIDGLTLSAVTMAGGAVPLLLVASPQIAGTAWGHVPAMGWGALAYSSMLALVLAYLFWYHGVKVIGPTRTAMYANLQPVVAVIVAWLVFGDVLSPVQAAGAGGIMAGLVLTRL